MQTVRINCGSAEDWTDQHGHVWYADPVSIGTDMAGGAPSLSPGQWHRIGGQAGVREPDLPLYPPSFSGLLRRECYGLAAYHVALPAGCYQVRLVVGETHETLSSHQRQFSLAVNDRELSTPVHPFAIAQGHARAGILSMDGVRVHADGLHLTFGAHANVCGVEVSPSDCRQWRVETHALAPYQVPTLPDTADSPFKSMLFTGHSGTFFWAIPETVQRMVALGGATARLEIDAVYRGGKGVQAFFECPEIRDRIAPRPWDWVVLQDSSWGPIETPEVFEEFMPQLIETVRSSGAQPILFAYSGPLRHSPAQRRQLQEKYDQIGRRMDVPVIPCAEALAQAIAEHPTQNFHNPDKHHTGMMAGYLFACVWYRALTGMSASALPEHTTLAGHVTVPADMASALCELADRICCLRNLGTGPANAILSATCALDHEIIA
ncbi:MAG: SGNH/GDSL hydrolase family protein [Phycisphaeraceae bacterium]